MAPPTEAIPVCRFFKVFFPDLYSRRLEICPGFRENMNDAVLGGVSLMGPSGNVWDMEVEEVEGRLFFCDGWEDFVSDHCLQTGEFLVFEYGGGSIFNVIVLDHSACEKKAAFMARPARGTSSFKMNIHGTEEEEEGEEKGENGSRDIILHNEGRSSPPSLDIVQALSVKKGGTQLGTWLKAEVENPEEKRKSKKHKKSDSKNMVRKRKRQGSQAVRRKKIFVSQRRPVQNEEMERARVEASCFKSNNPFFMMIMRKYSVYTGYTLNIPNEFARPHLPKTSKIMILQNSEGQSWKITCIPSNQSYYFSAGWRSFCEANHLEEYDACVFELIDKDILQVHIFRVMEELTPMIPRTV